MKHLRHITLLIFCCFILQSCYRILPSKGGGQISCCPERLIDTQDILVPEGYKIEVVTTGLTFPTAIAFDKNNIPYVIEAGYSYGEEFLEPRLLRINGDGSFATVFTGDNNGPWNGITYHEDHFYIAEGGALKGGKIFKINPQTKDTTALVSGLPSIGDHHTNGPAIKDGYLYFGQGTATNSGVVGNDNAKFGWLYRHEDFHDIPCEDVVLTGRNFVTENILSKAPDDNLSTGPYSPYGMPVQEGQVIKGQLPCNGAIMRIPLQGGDPELVAWGLRNPYGMAFSPEGQLFITENSYDVRGSRPVWGTGDVLWKIESGKWYGWPDYNGSMPLSKLKVPGEDSPKSLLAAYPNDPPYPAATLGVHSSSNGMDFSRSNQFGFTGEAFIAQFGDMAPNVGKVLYPVGFKVVRVDVKTGIVESFAVNKGKRNGPASWVKNGGLERPVSVKFNNSGDALYIVDFGIMVIDEKSGVLPQEKTGVIWKITKN